jgi:hypothetical protein
MRGKFDVKKGSSGDPRFAINTAGSNNTETELLTANFTLCSHTDDCKIHQFHDDQNVIIIIYTAVILVQPINCYQVPGSHYNIFYSEDTGDISV